MAFCGYGMGVCICGIFGGCVGGLIVFSRNPVAIVKNIMIKIMDGYNVGIIEWLFKIRLVNFAIMKVSKIHRLSWDWEVNELLVVMVLMNELFDL